MNILFIGNSYTYYHDMPTLFSRLCGCNGRYDRVFSVTKGGRKLHENLNPQDETTLQLEAVVRENTMDVCFLQEHSTLPILDYQRFCANIRSMMEKLMPRADRFFLYQTWGRKEGSAFLREQGLTTHTMTLRLAEAYDAVAQDTGAKCSPVGLCFWEVSRHHPQIELYDPDLTHPSYAGSCLAAMVHYRTLFGVLPADTSCFEVPAEWRAAFCHAIDLVFDQKNA